MIKKIALTLAAALAALALSAAPATAQQGHLEICDGSECWTLPTPEPTGPNCAEIADVAISHSTPPVDYTGTFNSYFNSTQYTVSIFTSANCNPVTGEFVSIGPGSAGSGGGFDGVSYLVSANEL